MADDAMNCGKDAADAFCSGLFCAEAVLLATARHQGVESDLLPAVATAFCSGMARTEGTCGAVTGALMGLGLAYGRSDGREIVDQAYEAAQALVERFTAEFGTINCRELLDGCALSTAEGQTQFRERRLHERCLRYTRRAAELCAQLIGEG